MSTDKEREKNGKGVDTRVFDDIPEDIREASSAYVKAQASRIKAEGATCAICGLHEGEDDPSQTTTFTEVRFRYTLTLCHQCAAGVAIVLFKSLPTKLKRSFVRHAVVDSKQDPDDLSRPAAEDMATLFTMLDPSILT